MRETVLDGAAEGDAKMLAKIDDNGWLLLKDAETRILRAVLSPAEFAALDQWRGVGDVKELLAALKACDVSMDTAADYGIGDILPPAYRDSWAAAHAKARDIIAAIERRNQ